MLETGIFLVEEIFREVPHRHVVFTIPKMIRKSFFWHRETLNDLSRLAWKCLTTFMQGTLGVEGRPGAVLSIETSGEYLDLNPHIHALVTDGIFKPDAGFLAMPGYQERGVAVLKSLWEKAVLDFAVKREFIKSETANKLLSWRHTGFSVFANRRVDYRKTDEASVAETLQLARYIAKPHFALGKMKYAPVSNTVLYHGGMHAGRKQNFVVFAATDFLAAVTSHIPNHRQKYINFYGTYSNRTRGKQAADNEPHDTLSPATESQKEFRKTWAMLIQQVWEVDPLVCPECGKEMKVVQIIQADPDVQADRLLESGKPQNSTGPPMPESEITYEPFDDGWAPA
jgi:hypothetical protein